MYPQVNKHSFCALKRFCTGRDFARTKKFIDKIWNKEAINEMIRISSTYDFDGLVYWLINPDLDTKISTINNYYSH